MDRRRTIAKVTPVLLSVGLALSACATAPDYGTAAYPGVYSGYEGYPYDPAYGSLGFGFGGFDNFRHDRDFHHDRGFHHDRDFGHGHDDHNFAQHAGHGFGGFGGHGFAAHGGFGGHRA